VNIETDTKTYHIQFSNFIQYKNRSDKRNILDHNNARTELLSVEF